MHGYQDGLWTGGGMDDGGGGGGGGRRMAASAAARRRRRAPPKVTLALAQALEKLSHASMRCSGCGAKVGVSVLSSVMARLREGGHLPADRPRSSSASTSQEPARCSRRRPRVRAHRRLFRSLVGDPYVFGQVAANHALSDCHAMNAKATGALAVAVVPYGLDAKVEETLFHMMAGAAKALKECGCALLGGHSCEGAELSLGFCVTGHLPASTELKKAGMAPGERLPRWRRRSST